jgi:CheY-like chemotaxis protein
MRYSHPAVSEALFNMVSLWTAGLAAVSQLQGQDFTEDSGMICSDETHVAYDIVENPESETGTFDLSFAGLAPQETLTLNLPKCLVVSSDAGIRRELAELLRRCGLALILVSTLTESRMALTSLEVCIVLCDECVVDGNYPAILEIVEHVDRKIPVIVISRTGEWPEYLAAIRCGAFDYLAYPPIAGEFQRVIRNAFRERDGRRHFAMVRDPDSAYRAGKMA